ncbi:MAG: UTP--glucose-1-phosphate uridylyltransferase [Planctomycetes bacterium]|nr:UTP--glucose-1-phosphate uridylyltransferase [Planctomycetota bacterium]
MGTIDERYLRYRQSLQQFGQSHLLTYWEELTDPQRQRLLDDLDQVDFARCAELIDPYVRNRPVIPLPERIEPVPALPAEPDAGRVGFYAKAVEVGTTAINGGQVAAFTVAGGQGTRLGYDGPKGAFPASPVRSACLFRLFAEFLLGTQRRHGACPRWFIMTSQANHTETVALFEEHSYFGLSHDRVRFFRQGQMPAFMPDGRLALADRHRLALSPDGHGGSLRALAASGALDEMRACGVEYISYFQVDNPLVKAIDPLFIGLHALTGSEMSSKAVTKADDLERVGNFCLADGKVAVIEYSDLPDELALQKNADGSRRFDAGSIAIHVLSRKFVEKLTGRGATLELPWHRAEKRASVLNEAGQKVEPNEPNVVKLELFVFDAIPLAHNPLVLYTRREEEFSPVKNAEGVDSAVTARRDMVRRAARWLEACGCRVPRDAAGEPATDLEINPAYALDADDLRSQLTTLPVIRPGCPLLLGGE